MRPARLAHRLRARGAAWSAVSTNRRILLATATVAVMAALVMAANAARDLVIAYRFGRGDAVDAFFLALLLPSLAVQVTAATLAATTVPQFLRLRGGAGEAVANRFAASVMALGLTGFTAAALLLAAGEGPVMTVLTSGFPAGKAALTRALYLPLLVIVAVQGWSTLAGGLVNARERFALVAAAPVLRPLAVMLLLVPAAAGGPMILAWGLVAGSLLEAAVVGIMVRRVGLPLVPRWSGLDASMRTLLREVGPLAAGSILMGGVQVADQFLASLLAPGSVATFIYGGKVVSLLVGLGVMPLGVAVLPHFSLLASRRDWAALGATLSVWLRRLALVAIPLTAVCVLYSGPLVRLLFERGAFSAADVAPVARVQAWLLLQLPFYLAGVLCVRVLTALQKNLLVGLIAAANCAVNLAASLLLMRIWGVAGIALGTSLGYAAAWGLSSWAVLRLLHLSGGQASPVSDKTVES